MSKILKADNNIQLVEKGDILAISATNTTYSLATETSNGLMDAVDKIKLNSLDENIQDQVSTNTDAIEENKNNIQIIQNRTEELDEAQRKITNELNNELKSIIPKKTITGTNTLTYDKSLKFGLFNALYKGNEKQETTAGKNKCMPEVYPYYADATNRYAISLTPLTSPYTIPTAYRGICVVAKVEANKTYKFSSDETSGTYNNFIAIYPTKDDITTPSKVLEKMEGSTFTPTNSGYAVIGRTFDTADKQVTWSYAQLEEGTTATPYEPYTGGAPAPNPDYPQEVETLKSWNLFKNEPNNIECRGLTMVNNKNEISIKGNVNESNYPCFIFYADGSVEASVWWATASNIKKEKGFFTQNGINYILQIIYNGTLTSNPSSFVYDIGYETKISQPVISSTNGIYDLERGDTSEKINYIAIGFRPNSVVDMTFKIQITKDSKKPYLPYNSIGIKRTRKNLFDIKKHTNILDGTVEIIDSNSFTCNNSETWKGRIILSFNNLKKNTDYTFSYNSNNTRSIISKINGIKNGVTTAIISNYYYQYAQSATINTSDYEKIEIEIYATGNGNSLAFTEISNIQFEEGSTKTNFDPYQERIDYIDLKDNELLSTDELRIEEGKATLVRKMAKEIIIMRGTFYNGNVDRYYWFPKPSNSKDYGKYSTSKMICEVASIDNYPIHLSGDGGQTQYGICYKLNSFDTLPTGEELKEKLDGSIYYYELAEPQIIDLGEVQTISTLEDMNNVQILATLEPTYMEETYANDVNKEIEELKQALLSTGANI